MNIDRPKDKNWKTKSRNLWLLFSNGGGGGGYIFFVCFIMCHINEKQKSIIQRCIWLVLILVSWWLPRPSILILVLVLWWFLFRIECGKPGVYVYVCNQEGSFKNSKDYILCFCALNERKFHRPSLSIYRCVCVFVYLFGSFSFFPSHFTHKPNEKDFVMFGFFLSFHLNGCLLLWAVHDDDDCVMEWRTKNSDPFGNKNLFFAK